jgi:hypothetical protein
MPVDASTGIMAHAIQLAIAPVFLLSGVAALSVVSCAKSISRQGRQASIPPDSNEQMMAGLFKTRTDHQIHRALLQAAWRCDRSV